MIISCRLPYIKKYLEERYVSRLRLEHVDKLRKEAKIEIFLN